MNLPIYGYGTSVLKQTTEPITADYLQLPELIENMWETMENAHGCGLAAPQIGKSIQLFIVDSKIVYENMEEDERLDYFVEGDTGIRETFINAEIIETSSDEWEDIEGCLSLPTLSGKVVRPWRIKVRYQTPDFKTIEKEFSGMTARVIAHEYDHTQGILYVDRVKSLTKKLMGAKLKKLSKGKIIPNYKMKF